MLMPNDTTSTWYGFYNYNNELSVDSIPFNVTYNNKAKIQIFDDLTTHLNYLITMLSPTSPQQGQNTFRCTLHESFDFINFTQVNNAQMYLKPWLNTMNHISSNNTNPVDLGTGLYEGKVNFDYPGSWAVYDSIYYNNKWITPLGNPPALYYQVP